MEELDGKIADESLPLTDIYLQEFFLYAYTFITKERKGFHESREGYTYIKHNYEVRQTKKILGFLYGDQERDSKRWENSVNTKIKRLKVNPMDEVATDFIDIDTILSLYVQEYQLQRSKLRTRLKLAFQDEILTSSKPLSA